MDLVTLAYVRTYMNFKSDEVGSDQALSQLITAVSVEIERYLDRGVEAKARTEKVWLPKGSAIVNVSSKPISDIASATPLNHDELGLEEEPEYLEEPSGIRLVTPLTEDTYIEVEYTGGMAASTAAFMTAYPDLTEVAARRVALLHKRKSNLDLNSLSGEGGSTNYVFIDLSKRDRETLNRYRRVA